jgi:hypothetical protein
MKHPSRADLALYAGGDLGLWQRLRVGRHAARCVECGSELKRFRTACNQLRAGAMEMPPEVNWNRLAAEMKANIRLGLEAGECVAPASEPPRAIWRPVAAIVSAAALVVAGLWLNVPDPRVAPPPETAGIVLESTSAGIEVQENGRALTLVYPRSEFVIQTVGAQGALRARYVDSETGQVTITNVYAQ